MSFSVLIAVYNQEQPHFLQQALESLLQQTLLPNEVIVVEDGPLTPALNEVLAHFQRQYKACKRVAKPRQEGLGLALNEGLKHCQHDVVARMDSDDICMPQRFEKQLSYLQIHPEVDVVGSWVAEFSTTPAQVISVRCVPAPTANWCSPLFAKQRCCKRVVIATYLPLKITTFGRACCSKGHVFTICKSVCCGSASTLTRSVGGEDGAILQQK